MKNILILFFIVISIKSNAIIQMRNWTLPPNKVKMEWGQTPVVTTLPGSSTAQYKAANGVYDENNNLLFYVVDGDIRNATGVSLASVGSNTLKEVVLVPVPGTCRQYYVIIARATAMTTIELYRAIVDCSSGTATLSSGWTLFATQSGNGCGLAASKIISGSGSSAIRYLYAVSNAQLLRYTISSTGIGSVLNMSGGGVSTLSNSQCMPTEAELNFEGNKFAWGSTSASDGKVYEVNTSPPYTLTTYILPKGIASSPDQQISGIEYDGSNNIWVSARSGTSGNYGIYKILTGSASTPTLISGTSNYDNTQLELSIYGMIHAVSNSGTFGYIDPATNSFSTTTLNIPITLTSNLNASPLPGFAYSLPDQIDNENYAYFNGIPEANPAFLINTATTTNVCSSPQNVYNCVPIAFTNQSTNATSYTLQVNSMDANCNNISGAGYLTYSSGSTTTLPTDLRAMPGTNGTWLANNPGRYRVTLTASNGCTSKSTVALIQVNAAPTAAVASLQINNPVTGVPCYSNNAGAPCTLCTGAPTMNLASSTGTVTYYKKTVERLISGTWSIVYGPVTTSTPSGVSSLTSVYVTDVSFSYVVGGQYRVSVEVGNDCGSNTKTCYFTAVSCKTDGAEFTAIAEEASIDVKNSVSVYPNPSAHNSLLAVSLSKEATVSAFVTDLQGRRVLEISPSTLLNKGTNELPIPSSALASGAYIYYVSIDNQTTSGKLIKQ